MRTEPPKGDELDRLLAEVKGRVLADVGRTPPAKRTRIDRIIGGATAAVLLLGLGSAGAAFAMGILPTGPATHDEDAPVAAPASTPPVRSFPVATAPPDPGPVPRIGLTCDDVIDTAELSAFMGEIGGPAIELVYDVSTTADDAGTDQLGALTCDWSNGAERFFPGPGRPEAFLSVLPEGVDAAVEYVELYRMADPATSTDLTYGEYVDGPSCIAAAGYCSLNGVIGSSWVELRVSGIAAAGSSDDELTTEFRALTDPLAEAVAAATIADRWAPTSSSATAWAECADLVPSESIGPLVGAAELLVGELSDGPKVSQGWYAKEQIGTVRCHLRLDRSEATMGDVAVLPNGAWAVTRYADRWLADGGRSISLPVAAVGTAVLRCDDPERACRVDFAVEDDWVSVNVPPYAQSGYDSPGPIDAARAHVVEIATIVAERIAALAE